MELIDGGRRKPSSKCYKCGKEIQNSVAEESMPGAILKFEVMDPKKVPAEYVARQLGRYYQRNVNPRIFLFCWECVLDTYTRGMIK